MATLVALPVAPSCSAIHVQNALSGLPPAPVTPLGPGSSLTSLALDISAQTSQQIGPLAPPTPVSGSSINIRQQSVLTTVPANTITPQTTGPSRSSVGASVKQQIATVPTAASIALENCLKLEEAYLNDRMPIEASIQALYKSKVRSRLNAVLDHEVEDRLGYQQQLMYAAKSSRRPWKKPELKPSIVVSVATAKDRNRVKKQCNKLAGLKEAIEECHLRLMVVVDVVKLRAMHQVNGIPPATSNHHAFLDSSSLIAGSCGRRLTLSEPSAMTGEQTCTLGGAIVIQDRLYGLAAGHAFFTSPIQPRKRSLSISSTSSASDDDWLEDARNPFVFPDDEDATTESTMDDGSVSVTSSEISTNPVVTSAKPQSPKVPTATSNLSFRSAVMTPSIPEIHTNASKRVEKQCDWALVELPKSNGVSQNLYRDPYHGQECSVTTLASESDCVSGEVLVLFSPELIVGGHLSPNSACYGVGSFLFDVRLVVLSEDLPNGCSGAWVVQGEKLCGYIIAAREQSRWAYMMPIDSVLEHIRLTLNVNNVRLPQLDEQNLKYGRLTDLYAEPAANKQSPEEAAAASPPTVSPSAITELPPVAQSISPGAAAATSADSEIPLNGPRPQRPTLPKKESSFSVASRGIHPERQTQVVEHPYQSLVVYSSTPASNSRSLAKNTPDHGNMPDKLKNDFIHALHVTAIYTCWPCLRVVGYIKRPRKGKPSEDVEQSTTQPAMSEKARRIEPMEYRPQTNSMRVQEPMATGTLREVETTITAGELPVHPAPIAVRTRRVQTMPPKLTVVHPGDRIPTPNLSPYQEKTITRCSLGSALEVAEEHDRYLQRAHLELRYQQAPTAVDHYVQRHRTRRRANPGDVESVTVESIVLSISSNGEHDLRTASVPDLGLTHHATTIPGIPASNAFASWSLSPPLMASHPRALSTT